MYTRVLASALFVGALLLPILVPTDISSATMTVAASTSPRSFASETDAQRHCPNDHVVWLNISTGAYHERQAVVRAYRERRLRVSQGSRRP